MPCGQLGRTLPEYGLEAPDLQTRFTYKGFHLIRPVMPVIVGIHFAFGKSRAITGFNIIEMRATRQNPVIDPRFTGIVRSPLRNGYDHLPAGGQQIAKYSEDGRRTWQMLKHFRNQNDIPPSLQIGFQGGAGQIPGLKLRTV